MRFLVSALGSAGDVHPFLAISQALLERGHAVRMLASPHFEERIRRTGVDFVPLGTSADYERVLEVADLWHPRRGARLVLDALLDRLPEAYAATAGAATPDSILVGSSLSWAIRLLQEKEGHRAATVHLSPTLLMSTTDPSVMPGLGDVSWMPSWALRGLYRLGDRLVLDRWIAPRLDRLRDELGLPRVRRIWSRWMHSPDLVVEAWPAWFAPPQPDWPARSVVGGFPLFDEAWTDLDPALSAFLDAGPPPIGMTPGSAMAHGQRFFARALDAAQALGRRAVLVTPFAGQLPTALPEWAHHATYAPYRALLPRLSSMIHHGGIGTSARCLSAGIPQLVVPFAHDQFDNAVRLQRLGVARSVDVASARRRWTAALDDLSDSSTRTAVDECARRLARETSGAIRIADLLERLGAGPS